MVDFKKTGQFIQSRRKEKNLTQRQLAELLGVSDKTISKWETGNGIPDFALVPQLCQILGIKVNELLSGEALSSQDYPEKAEANMISLLEDLKRRNIKNILFTSLGVVLIIFSALYLIWTFGNYFWHVLNWFIDPPTLISEGLFLGAFFLMSSGMKEKERFQLSRKWIISVGIVISLFLIEVELLQLTDISQFNALSLGICFMPVFHSLCIYILLIFAEVIREKTTRRREECQNTPEDQKTRER